MCAMESSPWASGPSSLPPHCPLSLSAAGCRGRPAWDPPKSPGITWGTSLTIPCPGFWQNSTPQLVSRAPNSSRASSSFAFFCKINHQERGGEGIMEQNRTLQLRQRCGSGTELEEARTHTGQQLAPDLEPYTRKAPAHSARATPGHIRHLWGAEPPTRALCRPSDTPPPAQYSG